MKKLFFILFVLVAFTAKSQVIDTAFRGMAACKVIPFKAKWSDTTNVTHLGVRIVNDDLKASAILYWALMDTMLKVHIEGNTTISGDDYKTWDGNNIFPFAYVGKLYNIVFIKPENE